MPRRRDRVGAEEEGGVPGLLATSVVGGESFVRHIYRSILSALESGGDVKVVMERYMPMLLNEIESWAMIYPEVKDLFLSAFRHMWERAFPNIPCPEVEEEETATVVTGKVFETLKRYADKIEAVGIESSASTSSYEIESTVRYITVQFMESVCRYVFKVMGVLT